MAKCKMCTCDDLIRIKLESLVDQGLTYLKVSIYAKREFGFSISHTSIQRHHENHVKNNRNDKINSDSSLTEYEVKQNILKKLRILVNAKIIDFSNGNGQFPKEAGQLLAVLEKTYKEDVQVEAKDTEYFGPNDDFVILPAGRDDYTPAEFVNYMCYAKMMIGLSTRKPKFNLIIEPPDPTLREKEEPN